MEISKTSKSEFVNFGKKAVLFLNINSPDNETDKSERFGLIVFIESMRM
jgi:hypothetical protein